MAQEYLVKELETTRNNILQEKEEYWRERSRAIGFKVETITQSFSIIFQNLEE
jgi:hypothetical protein